MKLTPAIIDSRNQGCYLEVPRSLTQQTRIPIPSRPVVPDDYNLIWTVYKITSKVALRTSEVSLNHKIFSKILTVPLKGKSTLDHRSSRLDPCVSKLEHFEFKDARIESREARFSERTMLYSHVAIQIFAASISAYGAVFCNCLNCLYMILYIFPVF